ncbi:TonB-dependent siderophore myxochelin receptor MxcH [Myxococcus sp. K15C18031901]|uniref:TonB-dependent siderophore myxochelin receptor MxcH n=1 Tax=Myxococcus dinghuensis TaxID=2906761 RepID=UPI0020A78B1C|nr:TonB-dependent siderophore myxochelin receptor MxcH [Myxococcus dinghuensis]MCP3097916.1 TonB-dependent siderophore myxochelin receptor MxcH [Myxococcus dinghuensis]
MRLFVESLARAKGLLSRRSGGSCASPGWKAVGLMALSLAAPAVAQESAPSSAPPATPAAEPRPTVGEIAGRVSACEGGDLSQAEVLLLSPDGATQTPRLDGQRRFSVSGLAPGTYELHALVPGCEPQAWRVQVSAGERTQVDATLAQTLTLESTIEVEGRKLRKAEERALSSEAVHVVELEEARQQTADLGEVLSRNSGVSVQRTGGLGSASRFSLNGFSGEQVRFFLDGVPLDLAGFGLGLANVPVNLLQRVEVYRGVVPVRFGADALGGAVNLVSADGDEPSGASLSLQAGSFGTYRGSAAGQYRLGERGLFVKGHVFGDLARNDYKVDVEVPDERGRLQAARVPRFHDGFTAGGAGLEVGVVDKPFADRLSLRVFGTRSRKELQNNVVMTVPYGEARSAESGYGALATWAHQGLLDGRLRLEALGGYSRRDTDFRDLAMYVYDWYGNRGVERRQPGELGATPADQVLWQHSVLARVHAGYALSPDQQVRLTLAPTFVTREGEDRLKQGSEERDPLSAQRDLLTLVGGLEHELKLMSGRMENVLFVKGYVMRSRSEEVLPGNVFRQQDQSSERVGVGDSLRVFLPRGILAKLSYEYTTRLPGPDELFGDGVLILSNLSLRPELSHNANLEFSADDWRTGIGSFRGSVGGFARLADQLIVLLGNDTTLSYQNVYAARSLGVEASVGWTVPGDWLALDANGTWQDFRNAGGQGAFSAFDGDRIPNRPWLFANVSARLQRRALLLPTDSASLGFTSRYVHGFYRGWESQGLREYKQQVDAQLTHSVALSYVRQGSPSLGGTLEVLNLTNAKTYDFFGVQRPGRSLSVKVTADF